MMAQVITVTCKHCGRPLPSEGVVCKFCGVLIDKNNLDKRDKEKDKETKKVRLLLEKMGVENQTVYRSDKETNIFGIFIIIFILLILIIITILLNI